MYFFVLNIGVFILSAAFVVVLLSLIAADVGWVETNYSGQPKDSPGLALFSVSMMLILMTAEIVLIYRLSRPLTDDEKASRDQGKWIYGHRGEFVADFGLFAYMMMWQVFTSTRQSF